MTLALNTSASDDNVEMASSASCSHLQQFSDTLYRGEEKGGASRVGHKSPQWMRQNRGGRSSLFFYTTAFNIITKECSKTLFKSPFCTITFQTNRHFVPLFGEIALSYTMVRARQKL